VALFGPTSPERHLPPGENIKVIRRNLTCHPCYDAKCKTSKHHCMKEIAAQEVFLEVKKFMVAVKSA
jgi:ADP-heptose:LPS heptosyltransferase